MSTLKEEFLERLIEGKDWEIDQLSKRLTEAAANAERLHFLQQEGYAWPNDYIDRHMKICKDKRSQA